MPKKMTTPYLNTWNELANRWTDNFYDKERQTKELAQAWIENLRGSTIDSRLSNVWTRSDLMQVQTWLEYEKDLHTLVWFLSAIDKLLQEIDDIQNWISKRWQTEAWKETMKIAKTKLKQYKKELKTKKKALLKQKSVEIYNEDINNLRSLKWEVEKVKKSLFTKWQRWELWTEGSFSYRSPEIARKSNIQQEKLNEFEKYMKEEVKQWAILNIFNWHEENAINFYRKIAEWHYTQAEYNKYTQNAWVLNPSFQRCGINVPILTPEQLTSSWQVINTGQPQLQQRVQENTPSNYDNLDRWEAFQKWWLAWLFDKGLSSCSNMTPWQKNTWKSIGVLWTYAAWIFWLYKFFTSKKRKRRQNALIAGGTIFWTQAITWENPISLFNKLMTWWFSKEWLNDKFWNLFWDAVNWVSNAWTESSDTVSPAMYSMMIFNSWTTAWDIRWMTDKFKSDPNSWKDFRWEAINKLRNQYGERSVEHFSATFSDDTFDEEKRKNRLASFWITDSTNDKKLIYEYANNTSMNSIVLQKFVDENWLKITDDKTKKEEFKQYKKDLNNKNQAMDINVLQSHKDDRFSLDDDSTFTERPEDIQNREKLVNQVNNLALDDQTKEELKKEIQVFYNERSIKSKPNLNDFSLEMENNLLILKSHQ